jgi:PTH1 family peptidyl-tRNA hydrolase
MGLLKKLFKFLNKPNTGDLKKFLIVGLGNIGTDYHHTRHNIGFDSLDDFAQSNDIGFEEGRYGALAKIKIKGKNILLLKPSTFMNHSGKAVRYWAIKENIPLQNLLIITDDLNLPFGTLRLKTKGSDGGHNGLKDIQAQLNTSAYPRLRFGIKNENKGFNQVDFVLGKWSTDEHKALSERYQQIKKIITSFVLQGATNTMNQYNGK